MNFGKFSLSERLAIVAGLLSVASNGSYVLQVITGAVKPAAVSWGLWSLITVLNFGSYKSMSRNWVKSGLSLLGSIQCILIFVTALFVGTVGRIDRFDIAVAAIGVIAAVTWHSLKRHGFAKAPHLANLIVQVALTVGFIPSFRSVWANPNGESALCWFGWTLMFAVQTAVVRLNSKERATPTQWEEFVYPVNSTLLHLLLALTRRDSKSHVVVIRLFIRAIRHH